MAAAEQISCCGLMPSTPGPMLSGVRHRPYPLLEREVLKEGTAESPGLIRVTFGLPSAEETLGFGQPSADTPPLPSPPWPAPCPRPRAPLPR